MSGYEGFVEELDPEDVEILCGLVSLTRDRRPDSPIHDMTHSAYMHRINQLELLFRCQEIVVLRKRE